MDNPKRVCTGGPRTDRDSWAWLLFQVRNGVKAVSGQWKPCFQFWRFSISRGCLLTLRRAEVSSQEVETLQRGLSCLASWACLLCRCACQLLLQCCLRAAFHTPWDRSALFLFAPDSKIPSSNTNLPLTSAAQSYLNCEVNTKYQLWPTRAGRFVRGRGTGSPL